MQINLLGNLDGLILIKTAEIRKISRGRFEWVFEQPMQVEDVPAYGKWVGTQ